MTKEIFHARLVITKVVGTLKVLLLAKSSLQLSRYYVYNVLLYSISKTFLKNCFLVLIVQSSSFVISSKLITLYNHYFLKTSPQMSSQCVFYTTLSQCSVDFSTLIFRLKKLG